MTDDQADHAAEQRYRIRERVTVLEGAQTEVTNVLTQHLALIRGQTTALNSLLERLEELENMSHIHASHGPVLEVLPDDD